MKRSVLYICFNRPEMVEKTFGPVCKNNEKIYVSIDGPRNEKDEKLIKKTYEKIEFFKKKYNVEIKYRMNQDNLGCGKAVSSAVSWFFKENTSGVIIEDDILVSDSFFQYADWALDKYKDSKDVGLISGYYHKLSGKSNNPVKIYKSYIPNIWAWGSWADRWSLYDYQISDKVLQQANNTIVDKGLNKANKNLIERMQQDLVSKKVDTWDYQMYVLFLSKKLFSINIDRNLAINLDIDGGTHGKRRILKRRDEVMSLDLETDIGSALFESIDANECERRAYIKFIEKTVFSMNFLSNISRFFRYWLFGRL